VTNFAPSPDASVSALALAGSVLYAGGSWYSIDGAATPHVAAFDATTGRASPWNPRANDDVEAIAVDAAAVYVAAGSRASTTGSFAPA
jgi:hypothetical protein